MRPKPKKIDGRRRRIDISGVHGQYPTDEVAVSQMLASIRSAVEEANVTKIIEEKNGSISSNQVLPLCKPSEFHAKVTTRPCIDRHSGEISHLELVVSQAVASRETASWWQMGIDGRHDIDGESYVANIQTNKSCTRVCFFPLVLGAGLLVLMYVVVFVAVKIASSP